MKEQYFMPIKTELENKKVLVACPFYEHKGYCTNAYFNNIKNLKWNNKSYFFVDNSEDLTFYENTKSWCKEQLSFEPGWFHTPYVKTSRKRQVFAFNKIREHFLKGDYDHLMIVESDLFPHEFMIPLLMRWDKDVVGTVYYIGENVSLHVPCCTTDAQNLNRTKKGCKFGDNFLPNYAVDGSLRKIKGGLGFGCVLIKRKVLEMIKFRSALLHADTYFHQDCEKFGFERWIDTSQIVLHDPSEYHDF